LCNVSEQGIKKQKKKKECFLQIVEETILLWRCCDAGAWQLDLAR